MGPFCGSWLASDSGTAPGQALCGDAIASKPAPTEGGGQWGLSVGAGWPAIQAPRRVWRCAVMLSPASRLLQRVAANGAFLWELACQRFRHRAGSGIVRGCYRQQAGSYRGWRTMGPFCGSWLASDSGTAPGLALCGDAIAGKPAPTEGGGQWGLSVGAGLPAIQAQRRVWRCAVMLSPASRLLQGGGGQWGLSVGAGLPAIQAPRRVWHCAVMLSPASRLLQRVAANGAFLWELASQRFRHRAVSGVVR